MSFLFDGWSARSARSPRKWVIVGVCGGLDLDAHLGVTQHEVTSMPPAVLQYDKRKSARGSGERRQFVEDPVLKRLAEKLRARFDAASPRQYVHRANVGKVELACLNHATLRPFGVG